MPPESDATVPARVADLRELGLFADRAELSDDALAAEITASLVDRGGPVDQIPRPLLDLVVAEQDDSRVWWRDLEADVANGNGVYAATLEEWGEISVGDFMPTDIAESWSSETGPVTVTYRHNGADRALSPAYFEDWIDPGILAGVNEAIAGSGRRFELYKAFDQTAFVMALSDAERAALEKRGWCFE